MPERICFTYNKAIYLRTMIQFHMLQLVTFTLIPYLISFYQGQILIETETDSLHYLGNLKS